MKKLGFLIVLAMQLSFLSAQKIDTFYIDSSGNGDFTTFKAAVEHLDKGISNPTVFLVEDGIYLYDTIKFTAVAGASDSNYILFKGKGSNAQILNAQGDESILFDGAQSITLDNLIICGRAESTIRLTGNSRNIQIRNCDIINGRCSLYGILISDFWYGLVPGNNAQNIVIESNNIVAGICIGISDNSARKANITIQNNLLSYDKNFNLAFYNAIIADDVNDITIHGNYITSNNKCFSEQMIPLQAQMISLSNVRKFAITSNIINKAAGGISIYNKIGAGETGLIANNYLNLWGVHYKTAYNDDITTGIKLHVANHVDVIHNTVVMNEETKDANCRSLWLDSLSNCRIFNNIFNQEKKHICVSLDLPFENVYLNYNSYNNFDKNRLVFEMFGNQVVEAIYKLYSVFSPHDYSSYFNQTSYFIAKDTFRLDSTKPVLYGLKSEIEYDIVGNRRCTYRPKLGAYEFISSWAMPDAGIDNADTFCTRSAVSIKNTSPAYYGSQWWYVNDSLISESYHFKFLFDKAGTYEIKLIVEDCGGYDTATKNIVVVDVNSSIIASQKQLFPNIDTLSLSDFSKCSPDSIKWHISPGDFTVVSGALDGFMPEVVFNKTGTYSINMTTFRNGAVDLGKTEIKVIDSIIFELKGPDSVSLKQCELYIDQGVNFRSYTGVTLPVLLDTTNLNTSLQGNYFHVYCYYDQDGQKHELKRYIKVTKESTPPIIKLAGNEIDSIRVFENYIDPGITVFDSCSGVDSTVVNNHVNTSVVGVYYIEYICVDYYGNQARSVRQVKVYDDVAPEIQLKGDRYDTVEVYARYIDPGVMATDNYCTQLRIKTYSNLDSSELGAYFIVYYAEDCDGNLSDSVVRYVQVVDLVAPVFFFTGPDTISIQDGNTGIVNSYLDSYYLQENYDVNLSPVYYGSYFSTYLVNPSPGCYKVLGQVTDLSGNNSRPDSFFVNVKVNSIDEQNNSLNVQIYPNPSKGDFYIEFESPDYRCAEWSMNDINGKLIRKGNISETRTHIYENKASKGLYFIKVSCVGKTGIYPIFIQD